MLLLTCILSGCYDAEFPFTEDLTKVKKDGKFGLVTRSGKKVLPCEYDKIEPFADGLVMASKEIMLVNDLFGFRDTCPAWALFDENGKEILPCEYEKIEPLADDLVKASELSPWTVYTRKALFDESGNEIIPFKYGDIEPFLGDLLSVKEAAADFLWGLIDKDGNEVMPAIYNSISKASELGAFASKPNPHYRPRGGGANMAGDGGNRPSQFTRHFIDKSGKECPLAYSKSDDFGKLKVNGKWGLINENGTVVLPFEYDGIEYFGGDLAAVKVNGKWKITDMKGNEIVPHDYDDAVYFIEGLAAVKIDGKWGIVDENGLVVPHKYDSAYFNGYMSIVEMNGESRSFGYRDKEEFLENER